MLYLTKRVEMAEEKIYHIYAKDRCIFHSINQNEFEITWKSLNRLVTVLDTDYTKEDLSYEEVMMNQDVAQNSLC